MRTIAAVLVRGGAAAALAVIVLVGQPRSAEAGSPATPRHVVVQAYAADGLTEAERRAIEQSLAAGVRRSMKAKKGAEVVTGTPEDTISEAAEKALERSDKGLAEAIKRMRNLEDGALDLLDWAADEYQRYLPQLMARDGNANKLIEVHERTAIASFLNGDQKAATEALRKAFVLNPDLDYDEKIFPPQLEKLVVNERLYHDELGRGGVRVELEGGGQATVYVNGIARGAAPVTVDDLPAGPNVVSLVAPAAEPVIVIAQVAGGGDRVTVKGAVKLPKSVDRGPLAGTRGDVGNPHVASTIARAGQGLGADALVLALPTPHGDEIAVVAYVYDLRSGALVGRTEDTLPRAGADAEDLGGALMATVTWQPSIALGPKKPPIWKHKYFWPAVGAAAGVVLIAVVVGVATHGLSNGEKVSILPVLRF